jgi:hypothetical protein
VSSDMVSLYSLTRSVGSNASIVSGHVQVMVKLFDLKSSFPKAFDSVERDVSTHLRQRVRLFS